VDCLQGIPGALWPGFRSFPVVLGGCVGDLDNSVGHFLPCRH
jgi:hypothetical protein